MVCQAQQFHGSSSGLAIQWRSHLVEPYSLTVSCRHVASESAVHVGHATCLWRLVRAAGAPIGSKRCGGVLVGLARRLVSGGTLQQGCGRTHNANLHCATAVQLCAVGSVCWCRLLSVLRGDTRA